MTRKKNAPKSKSHKSIKITIPIESLKKFGKWIKRTFIEHGGKLSIGVLLMLIIIFGTRIGCQYDDQNGFQCKAGYTPPDPKKVKEAIKK